jgi:hypothetical protein
MISGSMLLRWSEQAEAERLSALECLQPEFERAAIPPGERAVALPAASRWSMVARRLINRLCRLKSADNARREVPLAATVIIAEMRCRR